MEQYITYTVWWTQRSYSILYKMRLATLWNQNTIRTLDFITFAWSKKCLNNNGSRSVWCDRTHTHTNTHGWKYTVKIIAQIKRAIVYTTKSSSFTKEMIQIESNPSIRVVERKLWNSQPRKITLTTIHITHTCMISHTIIAEFLQFHHLHREMNKTYWKLRIWLNIAEEIHSVSFDRRSGKFHFFDVENSSMHRHSILFNFIRVVICICNVLAFVRKQIDLSVRTDWVSSFFPYFIFSKWKWGND